MPQLLNNKIINPRNILIAVMAVIIYFILPKSCNKEISQQPVTITSEKIVNNVRVDSIPSKHYVDSVNKETKLLEKSNVKNLQEISNLQDQRLKLQQDNSDLLAQVKDDQLKNDLTASIYKLNDNCDKKDSAYQKSLKNLNAQLSNKNKIISEKDKLEIKLRSSIDTCAKALSQWQKYGKENKPRNKVSVGLKGMYDYVNKKIGYGGIVMYSMKNGYNIIGQYSHIFNTDVVELGFTKTISFRK